MRLNNRNKSGYFRLLITVFLVIFILGVITFLLEFFVYDYLDWSEWLLVGIPLFLLIIMYAKGRQIFEYDSDGEALNFKNKNVIAFLDKDLNDEFPKYKMLSYEIIDIFILKRLYITVSSKKNKSLILRYDISYLTKKELKDLIISLSKVIKTNKEQNSTHIS